MATAEEQKFMEMVPDHEKRLKALERQMAERFPEKDDKPKK